MPTGRLEPNCMRDLTWTKLFLSLVILNRIRPAIADTQASWVVKRCHRSGMREHSASNEKNAAKPRTRDLCTNGRYDLQHSGCTCLADQGTPGPKFTISQ